VYSSKAVKKLRKGKVCMKRQRQSKKPYRKPRLKVHGDLRALTRAKGGNRADGAGKPRTKLSGGNA
jgi:hypothetical protein